MSRPKRLPPQRGADTNQAAFRIMQQATAEREPEPTAPPAKNAAAVALGRLGGKKGGAARAAKLTPEQRSESARKAAAARWKKVGTSGPAESPNIKLAHMRGLA
jgi:hypothetical protein